LNATEAELSHESHHLLPTAETANPAVFLARQARDSHPLPALTAALRWFRFANSGGLVTLEQILAAGFDIDTVAKNWDAACWLALPDLEEGIPSA
jgi:hypothetical protein